MSKIKKFLHSFFNEYSDNFSEYLSSNNVKFLMNREDFIALKKEREQIYEKYPQIRHFIEDRKPMNFGIEEMKIYSQVCYLNDQMDILELKEAFKLGAKEAYIFFEEQDMLNI